MISVSSVSLAGSSFQNIYAYRAELLARAALKRTENLNRTNQIAEDRHLAERNTLPQNPTDDAPSNLAMVQREKLLDVTA